MLVPFWKIEVTLKINIWFFWENEIVVQCNLTFWCIGLFLSTFIFKKEVTHTQVFLANVNKLFTYSRIEWDLHHISEKKKWGLLLSFWEKILFQFGISFWQKKIKWKYFDIVIVHIFKRNIQGAFLTLPFVRKKVEIFEINFWQK